jgi:hypothetical protein
MLVLRVATRGSPFHRVLILFLRVLGAAVRYVSVEEDAR